MGIDISAGGRRGKTFWSEHLLALVPRAVIDGKNVDQGNVSSWRVATESVMQEFHKLDMFRGESADAQLVDFGGRSSEARTETR